MSIYLLIKTTGGYHEPAESEEVGQYEDRIEAEDRARHLNRTSRNGSYHIEEFVGCDDPADLNPEPGNGPSYTEVRNSNGSHK